MKTFVPCLRQEAGAKESWTKQPLGAGQSHKPKPHSQRNQANGAQAVFWLRQQLQQGAPHAARKQRPAKAFNDDGQPQGSQKQGVIEFHGFLVTENH